MSRAPLDSDAIKTSIEVKGVHMLIFTKIESLVDKSIGNKQANYIYIYIYHVVLLA